MVAYSLEQDRASVRCRRKRRGTTAASLRRRSGGGLPRPAADLFSDQYGLTGLPASEVSRCTSASQPLPAGELRRFRVRSRGVTLPGLI